MLKIYKYMGYISECSYMKYKNEKKNVKKGLYAVVSVFSSFIRKWMNKHYIDWRRAAVTKHKNKIFNDFYDISKILGSPIWVEWGTSLGIAREGDVIKHEFDLDFGMYVPNELEYESLIKELSKRGYKLGRAFFYHNKRFEDTFYYKNALIDITYYERNNNNVIYHMFETSTETKNYKRNSMYISEGFEMYDFIFPDVELEERTTDTGLRCICAKKLDEFVEIRYGEGWKIPQKDYDWKTVENYSYLGYDEDARYECTV